MAGLLEGWTFLNTRAVEDAGPLTEKLHQLGGRVIPCPVIRFEPPESWDAFDERLEQLSPEDWIVFTSATALRFTLNRLGQLGKPAAVLNTGKLAAVGPATAQALRDAGLSVKLVPSRYQAEGLLGALLRDLPRHSRIWLPRARKGRAILPDGLREAGHRVTVTAVYRTIAPQCLPEEALAALADGAVDWLLFTSSSTAANFARLLPIGLKGRNVIEPNSMESKSMELKARPDPRVACLGGPCAETAREHGFSVTLQPLKQDIEGLVEALCAVSRAESAQQENRETP